MIGIDAFRDDLTSDFIVIFRCEGRIFRADVNTIIVLNESNNEDVYIIRVCNEGNKRSILP